MKSGLVLFSFMLLSTAACDSDTTVATTDPDEDSALTLSIMTARGDTLPAPVENELLEEPAPAETIVQRAPRAAPQIASQIASQIAPPTPAIPPVRAAAPARETTAATTIASAPAPTVKKTPIVDPPKRISDADRVEAPRRTGIIAPGATLSLVTNSSRCSEAQPGSTLRAAIAQSIRGTNGVQIPQGSQAVVEITSIDKWGAGVAVRVKSVRVDGRSYPVNSRVTYVLPVSSDDGACIKARTRLEVETRDAVRIADN
jgi:hypothetical protein